MQPLDELPYDFIRFAEVEPNQKDDIIVTPREAGHVVGFLGDGINDATCCC